MGKDHSIPASFWSEPLDRLFVALLTSASGLSTIEAQQRLEQYGLNLLQVKEQVTPLRLFFNQ